MYDDEYYKRIRRTKSATSSRPVYELRQGERRIKARALDWFKDTWEVGIGNYWLLRVDKDDVDRRRKIEKIIQEGFLKTTKTDDEARTFLKELFRLVEDKWKMKYAFELLEQKLKDLKRRERLFGEGHDNSHEILKGVYEAWKKGLSWRERHKADPDEARQLPLT